MICPLGASVFGDACKGFIRHTYRDAAKSRQWTTTKIFTISRVSSIYVSAPNIEQSPAHHPMPPTACCLSLLHIAIHGRSAQSSGSLAGVCELVGAWCRGPDAIYGACPPLSTRQQAQGQGDGSSNSKRPNARLMQQQKAECWAQALRAMAVGTTREYMIIPASVTAGHVLSIKHSP
jgi:hypothetical protein